MREVYLTCGERTKRLHERSQSGIIDHAASQGPRLLQSHGHNGQRQPCKWTDGWGGGGGGAVALKSPSDNVKLAIPSNCWTRTPPPDRMPWPASHHTMIVNVIVMKEDGAIHRQ